MGKTSNKGLNSSTFDSLPLPLGSMVILCNTAYSSSHLLLVALTVFHLVVVWECCDQTMT